MRVVDLWYIRPVSTPPSRLLKVLGVAFGVAILVGNTIGSGILRTPGDVAAALPSPAWFLGVWIAGGVYAMLGAMSLAELGVMIPLSGGQYVFARRALGEYPAFVVGWTDWISTSAATAASAIALGELTAQMFRALSAGNDIVAIAVVLAFTAIQWIGVKASDRSQQLLSVLKVIAFAGIAVACFAWPHAAATATTAGPLPILPIGGAFATALVLVFQNVIYTYDGWNGVVYFSGEMRDPAREIPRSMTFGVLAVVAVYLALNGAFLHVLGISGLAGEKFAAAAAARVVFGAAGELIVRVIMLVSMLGLVNAVLMISSRVLYAMSADGLLPRRAAGVNTGGTPHIALAASAVLVIAFVLSGTFEKVLALAAFFYVLQYASSFTSLFVLRRREPDTPRPYRVPGYPYVPAIVLIGAIAFLVGNFYGDRENSIRAVILIVVSYPVYLVSRRLSRTRRA